MRKFVIGDAAHDVRGPDREPSTPAAGVATENGEGRRATAWCAAKACVEVGATMDVVVVDSRKIVLDKKTRCTCRDNLTGRRWCCRLRETRGDW